MSLFLSPAIWMSGTDAPHKEVLTESESQSCSAMTFFTLSICRFPLVRCPGISQGQSGNASERTFMSFVFLSTPWRLSGLSA
jgi:hypothetical protein